MEDHAPRGPGGKRRHRRGSAASTFPLPRKGMNFLPTLAKIALACAIPALVWSCATTPRTAPVSTDLLTQAGFKTVVAKTQQQQQHLRTLQQGTVSQMQQTGKHYYVYPDVPDNRLYVGTPKEYDAYVS